MVKPSGHSAVMAQRASPRRESVGSERADAPDSLDYFPTPPWAARAGGELIKRIDPGATSCWEPACGEGHMAWGLADYFPDLLATDIHDYGDPYGVQASRLRRVEPVDFLDPERTLWPRFDWVVTNPPFVAGEAFVRAGLKRARRGVAMLLRSVFLEGAGRNPIFSDPALNFALHAQFAERVPMVKGRWDPGASSATAYSWFVWVKPNIGLVKGGGDFGYQIRVAQRHGAFLGWVIPPGTKARLSKPEDLARFARTTPNEGEIV